MNIALGQPAPATAPQQTNLIADLATAAGSVLQIINQQKLAQINLKRAQENKPPITLDQIPGAVPTAAVSVGVQAGTAQMLTVIGVGALAVIALRMVMKRGRR